MDIALGVSMTPTTVRLVLVEGEKADGATVDYDVFDLDADGATSSPADQVIAAIFGTREGADTGGHRLVSTGVTWSDHAQAAQLREALAARRIDDVTMVSELHAAGALAQAAGRAVGYDKTAVLLIDGDAAMASVVDSADGSIVKVQTRDLHSTDAMDVLTEMATSLQPAQPDGIFVLGTGLDVGAVKQHLELQLTVPVSAPDDPEMALARGAALAAANSPQFDASTVGLAYSQDPDGTTAGAAYPADDLSTEGTEVVAVEPVAARADRKPFMLAGSSLTAIFVVGVVALVISLAVSIRPTVGSRPNPDKIAAPPSVAAAAPPAVQTPPAAAPSPPAVASPAPAAPPPVAETIAPPVPVVEQQPLPRKVVVAQAPAPKPAAAPPAPAPEAPPPAPAPQAPPPAPAYVPPQSPVYPPGYGPPQSPVYPPGYGPPQSPAYLPPQDYAPQPAAPVIGLPPIIGFGPGPSVMPRGSDPRWGPPQQEWPSGPGRYHSGRSPWWLWPGD